MHLLHDTILPSVPDYSCEISFIITMNTANTVGPHYEAPASIINNIPVFMILNSQAAA